MLDAAQTQTTEAGGMGRQSSPRDDEVAGRGGGRGEGVKVCWGGSEREGRAGALNASGAVAGWGTGPPEAEMDHEGAQTRGEGGRGGGAEGQGQQGRGGLVLKVVWDPFEKRSDNRWHPRHRAREGGVKTTVATDAVPPRESVTPGKVEACHVV